MSKSNKSVEKEMNIKGLVIIICVLLVVLGLIYVLTIGAQHLGWFDVGYTKPEVGNAVISYDSIMAGTIFDRSESEYYVLIADFDSRDTVYVSGLISSYKNKENVLPLYVVNTADKLNSSIVSDTANSMAQSVEDLKVSESTLIKISNHRNVMFVTGDANIKTELAL